MHRGSLKDRVMPNLQDGIVPIRKNGVEIRTLEEWAEYAPPKSNTQWVDGRSAKELARAWLGAGLGKAPEEVSAALRTHAAFGPIQEWSAEPEAKLRFDQFPGEPSNADLAVCAEDRHGLLLIVVEAKADEPFGEMVQHVLADAIEEKIKNERSNRLARVEQLAGALFHPRNRGEPSLRQIRYQLMTCCAGALCEAGRMGFKRALVLIQEFVTNRTKDAAHERNQKDLNNFIRRISRGTEVAVKCGEICGPLSLPSFSLLTNAPEFYIAKVKRDLRA